MRPRRALSAIFTAPAAIAAAGASRPAATATTTEAQYSAVRSLLSRILDPSAASSFDLGPCPPSPSGTDAFELSSSSSLSGPLSGTVVSVRGSSSSALTAGVGWYLRYGANVTLEWGDSDSGGRKRLRDLRPPLPPVPEEIAGRTESPVVWRYYMNVCTFGYSTAWWGWDRWEAEIDLMALRGVNLPLAFLGQELIWERVFLRAGLNASQLDDFFTGPAFLPWQRMGNVRKFGGPLPTSWRIKAAELQKRVLGHMRDLGMTPVLPAFAGHVPHALAELGANVTYSPNWLSFPEQDCCVGLLDASDPLFPKLGQWAIEEMRSEWGVDGVYGGDTFNEMLPPSFEPDELRKWGSAVYEGIRLGDSNGVWMLQGWLFVGPHDLWTPECIKAYLSAVPTEHSLVLDLFTERSPEWSRSDNFADRPWVWNMLQNFGGRRDMQGNLTRIATGPVEDLAASGRRMVGIGTTPEAIENNLIMFDLLFEMGWRKESPDVAEWVQRYATRRYGWPLHASAAEAWDVLRKYAYSEVRQYHNPVEVKPTLRSVDTCDSEDHRLSSCRGDNSTAYATAWRYLADAAEADPTNGPLLYDLVDVGRQVLANTFGVWQSQVGSYSTKCQEVNSSKVNCDATIKLCGDMARLIGDLDELMATNENFLLGRWLESARSWADEDGGEAELYAYNAKNQITWWGPNENIRDYASKPWAGLIGTYYRVRWGAFLAEVVKAAEERRATNATAAMEAATAAERAWLESELRFSTEPEGDTLEVTKRLLRRYGGFEALGIADLKDEIASVD